MSLSDKITLINQEGAAKYLDNFVDALQKRFGGKVFGSNKESILYQKEAMKEFIKEFVK